MSRLNQSVACSLMASCCIPSSLCNSSSSSSSLSRLLLLRTKLEFLPRKNPSNHNCSSSRSLVTSRSFSWDDVLRVSQANDSSNLNGFFERIRVCNRGSEMQSEFLPFVIEERISGYIHNQFVEHLRNFKHVFEFPQDKLFGSNVGGYVTLHRSLKTPDDRTEAVADVIHNLGGEGLIPGIRNELYPVTSSYGTSVFFSLERAAAPYFGIKAYGIQMNGFVESDGQKFLWIGKRSEGKQTYPGMLDQLAAGGLPHGLSCKENLIKECEEEAGIPKSISSRAVPVGAVSYMDINGYSYKRDVLFCYDLKLPDGFIPINQDGEVESFKLIPVTDVANIIRRTDFFKPNCALVIIDFLFRNGYIRPEDSGYLQLLHSLRSGDCS